MNCHLTNRSSGRVRDKVPSSYFGVRAAPAQPLDRMETLALASLGSRWQKAAQELEIAIEAPYLLVARDGALFEFACLLPQFGGTHGMVLNTKYDEAAANAATTAGFGFSYLSAGKEGAPFEIETYIDCLRDWGWSSTASPPAWLLSGGTDAV
jgi:hypothetical protein